MMELAPPTGQLGRRVSLKPQSLVFLELGQLAFQLVDVTEVDV
jgi:hypothetical protein